MKEIDLKDFDNFYTNELEPKLIKLEEERKKVRKNLFLSSLTLPIAVIVFYGIYGILFVFKLFPNNFFLQMLSFFTPIILAFFILVYGFYFYTTIQSKKEQYIRKLKTKIYTILFDLLDIEFDKLNVKNTNIYKTILVSLFKKNNKNKYMQFEKKFDDFVKGEYKNISFELIDIELKERNNLFNGLLLAVKINKNFTKETVIKSNNFKLFNINKEDVKLEDIEFPNHFKVYTDDQIEARYLLTPSFMERLKNYHKSKNDKTIIFFDSKVSSISNMFILTNTGKDNFEIPFNKSILNKEYYYNLIQELINMLEIASALKLEQNIGL